MDAVEVIDTRGPADHVRARARAARRDGRRVHLVVHPSTVDVAASVVAELPVDALVGPAAIADPGAASDGLHDDDSLATRLHAALADVPEDTHGPERPLPGFVLVLRVEGLAPAPAGVGELLRRRVLSLWTARLDKHDLLVPVDRTTTVAVVHGDQLRVDELHAGWSDDVAAFAPHREHLRLVVGVDAPNGTDRLDDSALRAADHAATLVADAAAADVGDDLLAALDGRADDDDPATPSAADQEPATSADDDADEAVEPGADGGEGSADDEAAEDETGAPEANDVSSPSRPSPSVRRAVLRAASALAAGDGATVDPGRVAAVTARDLAARTGLDPASTASLVAAARWHLLPAALVTSECGAQVGSLLDDTADATPLHLLLDVVRTEAARRSRRPQPA